MKIKKLFKYNRGRQIFRLLPTDTDKLIIEERDRVKKEAFFSCVNIITGKRVFTDLQFEEKYWIGIKEIYKDVIFFHRFERPDLPNHKGIIAYDINSKKILWENPNKFLFSRDDKLVFVSNEYGISKYFLVDYLSGEMESTNTELLNLQRKEEKQNHYIYSKKINQAELINSVHPKFKKRIENFIIKDYVNSIVTNNISFFNFHYINKNGKFDNIFFSLDNEGKILLKEILNKGIDKIEPESFFIKHNLLFLLFAQSGFGVYKII